MPSANPSGTSSPLRRLAGRGAVLALALWNGFVFSTRISNVLGDNEAAGATKAWAIALAVLMLVGAVALLAVLVAAARRPWRAGESRLVQAVAGLTVVVWAIRGIEIALADYSSNPSIDNPTGFKVVHLVLGVISIGLAAGSWRAASRAGATAGSETGGPVSPAREVVR